MADETQAPAVGIVAGIIGRFEALHAVRDRALVDARQIVRHSANAVRAVHRREAAAADELLRLGAERLRPLLASLAPYPEIAGAGYVQDAMREYAEARLLAAIVGARPWPGPDELGVGDAAYLNALAEAGSELRRQVLDLLRAGDLPRAERLVATMDDIYAALVLVDFPDAITGNLRRSVDALRAVLERTRGDLTTAVQQARLQRALRDVHERLGMSG